MCLTICLIGLFLNEWQTRQHRSQCVHCSAIPVQLTQNCNDSKENSEKKIFLYNSSMVFGAFNWLFSIHGVFWFIRETEMFENCTLILPLLRLEVRWFEFFPSPLIFSLCAWRNNCHKRVTYGIGANSLWMSATCFIFVLQLVPIDKKQEEFF